MIDRAAQISARSSRQEVLVAAAQADSHAGVAALTFLVWDTIIHMSDEVDYIWRGPNTWIKYLYIFIRWMPILGEASLVTIITSDTTGVHFSSLGCRRWITFEAAVMEAITFAVELVLIIRVYALYNRNKTILWTISLLFIAEITAMITVLAITIPRMTFNAQCLITAAPGLFMAFWLSSLAFETILFILTLIQFFKVVHRGLGERTLLHVFMRDGTWAFAMIFLIMLLNTLMYQLNDTPLAGICYFWAVSVMSFAGSHVLLNLRYLSNRPPGSSFLNSNSLFSTDMNFNFRHTDPATILDGDLIEAQRELGSVEYDSESTTNTTSPAILMKDL